MASRRCNAALFIFSENSLVFSLMFWATCSIRTIEVLSVSWASEKWDIARLSNIRISIGIDSKGRMSKVFIYIKLRINFIHDYFFLKEKVKKSPHPPVQALFTNPITQYY
jgi:hypothetical protein